jgi:hypothetical protein
MGDVTEQHDPARDHVDEVGRTAEARSGASSGRRRWWWVAGGGVLLLLVAWLGIGLNPRLGVGHVAQLGEPWVEVEDTWSDLDGPPWGTYEATDPPGDTAEFMVSFRNTGWVPVTLLGGRDDLVVERVQFVELSPRGDVGGEPRLDQVTVPPGSAVGIWQTVRFPCGATFTAGSGVGPGDIPLRARSLGLTRDLALPQTARVWLIAGTDRTIRCES